MPSTSLNLMEPFKYRGFWTIIKREGYEERREELLETIKKLNEKGFSGGVIKFPFVYNEHYTLNIRGESFLFHQDLNGDKREEYKFRKKPSVVFSFFSSIFDSRWRDMPIPPSILYLGSKTSKNSIETELKILDIERKIEKFPTKKIWGFTLFDDLLPEAIHYIDHLRKGFNGLIGIGGPFPTLSPIAAIVHLKSINFLLRGEGEESISDILYFISNINNNDPVSVFYKAQEFNGFFYSDKKYMILSKIDSINSLKTLDSIEVDFSIIPKQFLSRGLELNLSRGCPRSCIFCSHVHGKKFRMITKDKLSKILSSHIKILKKENIKEAKAFYININDDDILLGGRKVSELTDTIKENGYKIYGFQSSVSSFIDREGNILNGVIEIVADKALYVNCPLLWLGTDAFTEERRKRLGKQKISEESFLNLLQIFEKRGIKNYHYWIILDRDSTWEEFFKELFIIWEIIKNFKEFELLPTSSYLIPYPYTPSYTKAIKKGDGRVVLKEKLKSNFSDIYDYPLIKLERPEDENLFNALNPEKEYRTIMYLKNKDFFSAFQNLYSYFKKSEFYNSLPQKEKIDKIDWLESAVSKLMEN